jgi:hypothetical protein
VMQHKTQRPVQFEITPAARDAVQKWIKDRRAEVRRLPVPSRMHDSPHLGRVSTPESSKAGSRSLALTRLSTARTRCGEPRRR